MAKVRLNDLQSVRRALGMSQRRLSELLGISCRAVQSYEQGWRPVPAHVQKLAGLFLSLKKQGENGKPIACWSIRKCKPDKRNSCVAHEYGAGQFCWLISGTCCEDGQAKSSWPAKLAQCKKCDVMRPWLQY